MAEIILEAEHLSKVFTSHKTSFTAVEDVSFLLERGKCLGIVGESGSGKSTVAKIITRLLPATNGSIKLFGEEIIQKKGKELRAIYKEMQMVFQTPMESFDSRRTIGDGIGESLKNQGISKKEVTERVKELLVTCGLPVEFAKRFPHEVSGGQCQRAAIARALAVEPSILICDEVTSALDVTVQRQILDLLKELKQKKKLSFLFISHDLAVVQEFCEEVLVMYEGKIIERGTTDQIINTPQMDYTKKLIDSVL